MDINGVLSYLKEELGDIPANPDNIHYTDFEGLFHILKDGGIKGQKGGYTTKTKEDDMELATVRNSHKLSYKEQVGLSAGAIGGVKIELFTDRILAAHRGTRKAQIAELPAQTMVYLKDAEKNFRKYYDFDIPKFINKTGDNFFWEKQRQKADDMRIAEIWLKKNHPELSPSDMNNAITEITLYNRRYAIYYDELKNREREERLILKKPVPVDQKFMRIVIEKDPKDMGYSDKEFCQENAASYLAKLKKYEGSDVIVQNRNLRLLKEYLRSLCPKRFLPR